MNENNSNKKSEDIVPQGVGQTKGPAQENPQELSPTKANSKVSKKHFIIAAVILLVSLPLTALLVTRGSNNAKNETRSEAYQQPPTPQDNYPQPQQEKQDIKNFKFTRLPFDLADIGSIAPIGEFSGITRQNASMSHFAGGYRHYVFSKEPGKRDYNVYAPSDAKITAMRYSKMSGQYRFNFTIGNQSGPAFYYLDHIQSLSDDLTAKLKESFGGEIPMADTVEQIPKPIEVKAGYVLGKTGFKGIAWDWGMIDPDQCEGILKKDHYMQDMCPLSAFDYLPIELQEQIKPLAGYWADPASGGNGLNKVVNGPVLGAYGHDKAGTLSGAWFQKPKSWENAFFVPDPYAKNGLQIRLAIPELSVFGVFNKIIIDEGSQNPDPLKVTKDSGIVAYVLPKKKPEITMSSAYSSPK